MAEIDDIVRLGYDGLWIADDTFTLHRDYLEEFCRRVAPLGLTWSCLSRANGIDPVTAGMMRASGLPARLPRPGIRQPGDAGPHAEADDGRAGRSAP